MSQYSACLSIFQMVKTYSNCFTMSFCINITAIFATVILSLAKADLALYLEEPKMRNQISFENNLSVVQTMQCARQCDRHLQCESLFYNENMRECRLLNRTMSSTFASTVVEDGWTHHVRSPCPVGLGYVYDRLHDWCYKLYDLDRTVPEASETCVQDGGRLLRIDSIEKQIHIKAYIDSKSVTRNVAIAGRREDINSTWMFEDGTPLTFFNWHTPREFDGCIRLKSGKDWMWGYSKCDSSRYFLCETVI